MMIIDADDCHDALFAYDGVHHFYESTFLLTHYRELLHSSFNFP
jgi:hypothetical protein